MTTPRARYDRIGVGYSTTRQEDPRLAHAIAKALGDTQTVVNVGAGAGSYEPRDRYVLAIEPSDVMAAQRGDRVPAVAARAERLPLRDRSFDAAMSVLSLHHWDDQQQQGVAEMRRVARGPVVVVTYDPRICNQMWLLADYFPEVAAMDDRIFPLPETLITWLGGEVTVEPLPIPRDCTDRMLGAFWAHPEWVLDEAIRNGTSAFARAQPEVVRRVVSDVERDLRNGAWDARYGHLRTLDELDVGLRLIVGQR